MPVLYNVPPTFASGQALSASYHLNSLQRYIHGAKDLFLGYQMPIPGCVLLDQPFFGALRNKTGDLEYNVTTGPGATYPWRLYVNDAVKATISSDGNHTGTVSLSGLTTDEFYEVSVRDGAGLLQVNKLYQANALSLPTLASFVDGTSPTAAQWQALSTYASTLYGAFTMPSATFPYVRAKPSFGAANTLFSSTMIHRCRYLAYLFFHLAPYHWPDDDGLPWIDTYIGVNGVNVLRRRNGRATSEDPTLDFAQTSGADALWTGLLDLDTYPGTLSPGDEYVLTMSSERSTFWDTETNVKLYWMYEAPAPIAELAGWTDFQNWEHGDYAWGNATPGPGTRLVSDIKNNLELLGATTADYINPVTAGPNSAGEEVFDLYGVRQRRYLHYRNKTGQSPNLAYTYRNKETSMGLPDASERWLALDMQSADGLWPGTLYRLTGVQYAIEDDTP